MSERLNIVFHDETNGTPYALLSLSNRTDRMVQRFFPDVLLRISKIVHDYGSFEESSVSSIAAILIRELSGGGATADLLPPDASWMAYLTLRLTRENAEFQLACEGMNFAAIDPELAAELAALEEAEDPENKGSLDAFEGFKGSAKELWALANKVAPTFDG